jgi:hypothetical protein
MFGIPPISVLVEGPTDEIVVRRLLTHLGLPCGNVYGKRGKGHILANLPRYNRAARFLPWLVVVDLDRDAECAPFFVRDKLPGPATWMRFRVAVRAVEAWLLADAERLAAFLGVSTARIPTEPDEVADPKEALVNLARHSRRLSVREAMVPRPGMSKVGPGYVGLLMEFAAREDCWRPGVAALRSDSLRRCIMSLEALRGEFQ